MEPFMGAYMELFALIGSYVVGLAIEARGKVPVKPANCAPVKPANCAPALGALLVAFTLAVGACGDDADADADAGDEGGSLAVVTYNAGLARSFVDYAVERTEPVAEALAGLDADVLCLQEVWEADDWEAVIDASPLTHVHRLEPMPDATAGQGAGMDAGLDAGPGTDGGPDAGSGCEASEVGPLEACVRAECDVPPGELTSCALGMCSAEVAAVSPACLGCITGVIGDTDIDEIVATCGPEGDGGGSAYSYGGSFGTAILSDARLSDRDALVLESTTSRRAILHASIEGPDGEPVHLFCTHLTANLTSVPYTGNAGGWAEENADQVASMLDYIEDRAGGERYVLMGDLNTGPEVEGRAGVEGTGIEAAFPDSYAMLGGLENPYLEGDDVQCTFCADNPLVGQSEGQESLLIDHILVGDWPGLDATTERILDGTLELQVDGDTVDTAYSDHYGLRSELVW